MESQRPESSAAREETPLLGAARNSESEPGNEQRDQEAQISHDETRNPRPTVPRSHRAFYSVLVAQITLGVVNIVFDVATYCLLQYGSSRFGYYDYEASQALSVAGLTIAFAIVFSLANIARLKFSGQPIQPFLNIMVFGFVTFIIGASAVAVFMDRVTRTRAYCRADLEDGDYGYPGTMAECQKWAPKYEVISWIWIALIPIQGVLYLSLFIMSLVMVYRSRSWRRAQGLSSSSSWTLPAGQFAIEFAIRWGPPPSEAAAPSRNPEEPTNPEEPISSEQPALNPEPRTANDV